ncbi:hypothetical protein ACFL1M_00050 [Patescibacteria group bacterium]
MSKKNSTYPSVNFAVLHKRKKQREQGAKQRIVKLSTIFLAGYLLIFTPVLIIRFITSKSLVDAKTEEKELTRNIESLHATETKYLLIEKKLKSLSNLLRDKEWLYPKVVEIYNLIPNGSLIEDISFGSSGESLILSVSSVNVFVAGDLISTLSSLAGEKYSSVLISSVSRSVDGIYNLSLEFDFSTKVGAKDENRK